VSTDTDRGFAFCRSAVDERPDEQVEQTTPTTPSDPMRPSDPTRPSDPEPTAESVLGRAGVMELVVLVLLFLAYNVVRALPTTSAQVAVQHANRLLSLEGPLFSRIEVPLNQWLQATPALAVAACYYYAVLHYLATPAILLIARRRGGWPYWRGYWTLIIASALALACYAAFPVAPPRLVPDLGIIDVMRSYADYGWWSSASSAPRGVGDATNQYAALPSMHFGWALWCSLQMWGFGSRAWRALAIAYPSILVVVVIATGNHFVVDILAGAACVALAYTIAGLAHRFATSRSTPRSGRGLTPLHGSGRTAAVRAH
jgi:PAP2 superfamily protein